LIFFTKTKIKILFCFYFIFLNIHLNALTFKSDGTVISSQGDILTKSFANRYQEALAQYINNEEVLNWPLVELNGFGDPIKKKGFMGEKLLEEGAPLFAVPKVLYGDPVEAISLNNGLVQENFIQVMLANSSEEWSSEKGFNDDIIENAKKNMLNLVDGGFQEFKLTILSKEFIKETSKYESFEEIKNTESYTELSSKLNEFYGAGHEISKKIIEEKFKDNIDDQSFALNAKSLKDIIEDRTGISINDHGWTDSLVRSELKSMSDELVEDFDIDKELAQINEEAGKAAMDYANSDLKKALEEAANAAQAEAVNDVAARVAAAEAYAASASAARQEAERAVSEAASEEARNAALAELERTVLEEQGAQENLNTVIESESTP
jgi:hypothetical protein